MLLPQEIAVKSVIPAMRAYVGKKLIQDHGMTQQQVAKLLGVTQSAISNYMRKTRGVAMKLDDLKEVQESVDEIVTMLAGPTFEPYAVLGKFTAVCDLVAQKRLLCDLHKRYEPDFDIDSCHVCDQQWGKKPTIQKLKIK